MINTKFRKRPEPAVKPQQLSILDREFDGIKRLAHELFRRGRSPYFLDGVTRLEDRRERLRDELATIADEHCLSKPGVTLRQVFEEAYGEPLVAPAPKTRTSGAS